MSGCVGDDGTMRPTLSRSHCVGGKFAVAETRAVRYAGCSDWFAMTRLGADATRRSPTEPPSAQVRRPPRPPYGTGPAST
jgi:hypothetical protein